MPERRSIFGPAAFMVTAAIASLYYAHLRFVMCGMYVPGDVHMLFRGIADQPFQYRALTSWVARLIYEIPHIKENVITYHGTPLPIFYALEAGAMFFLLVAYRYYLSLFVNNRSATYILSFLLLYALPFNYLFPLNVPIDFMATLPSYPRSTADHYYFNLFYPYDTFSIMFFTLGLICLHKRKWLYFYLVFIVGTFNRETTAFLSFILLFTFWGREKKGIIATHLAVQLVVWSSIKYFLYFLYGDNPGEVLFYSTYRNNLKILSDISNWPLLLSSLGFLLVPVLALQGRVRDTFARRSLLVLVPFYGIMFYMGNIDELRIYGELAPVMLTAAILIMKSLLDTSNTDNASGTEPPVS